MNAYMLGRCVATAAEDGVVHVTEDRHQGKETLCGYAVVERLVGARLTAVGPVDHRAVSCEKCKRRIREMQRVIAGVLEGWR